MKKLWFIIVITITVGLCIFVRDIYLTKRYSDLLEHLQINLITTDRDQKMHLDVEIKGEFPKASSQLIIFADNRYLELTNDGVSVKEGAIFSGLRAGGTEAIFSLTSDSDGHIGVDYAPKNRSLETPLVYVFIETKIKRYLLGEKVIKSRVFQLRKKTK